MNFLKFLLRVEIIKDLFIHPKKALAEIDSYSEKYFFPAIAVLIFSAIAASIADASGTWSQVFDVDATTEPIDHVSNFAWAIVAGFFSPVLMLWIARKIYKVQSNFKRLFSTLTFAGLPFSIMSIPLGIVMSLYLISLIESPELDDGMSFVIISILAYIPLVIHLIILMIMATKQSLELRLGQVVAVWILSALIFLGIAAVFGSILGVLGGFGFRYSDFAIS
ncbi:YIP1 family protein [Nitrosopumilus sp.]|uniref:YIP1 family protein n=1 Tax=Nitrosopumilus sp. TaxID=2024843 RepID=UPI002633EDC4|nr:YIP1 family protein [Nitrosopumilus sp.]